MNQASLSIGLVVPVLPGDDRLPALPPVPPLITVLAFVMIAASFHLQRVFLGMEFSSTT